MGIGTKFDFIAQTSKMNIFYRLLFVLTVTCFFLKSTHAQYGSNPPVKVAVFTPLYLNDAFNGSEYKLGKSSLPKNILPGLEFYNGVMMAVDSLRQEGEVVDVSIYDSKQDAASLDRLMKSTEFANVGLIIASVTSPTEMKLFANNAASKKIPMVSATYPNYVGINQNPYFVLLNSSFLTHLQGIYKYMQRNYSTHEIIALKRQGATEDYIKKVVTDLNKTTPSIPLKIKWVDIKDDVNVADITPHLDSTRNNVLFVASPLEDFGIDIVNALGGEEKYMTTVVGMPTWDAVKEFNRRDNSSVEIVYSTPFHYSGNQELYTNINRFYKSKFYSRPSDMVFRGFETTFHFTKLLLRNRTELLKNLSSKDFTLFNQFDIQPVKLKATNAQPDFMENKKLYFVKKREGSVISVN